MDEQHDLSQFLREVMQQIAQVGGDSEKVYEFWKSSPVQFNQALLTEIPSTFQELRNRNPPKLVATLFVLFGNLIQEFPLGSRRINLEISISAYEQAIKVYIRDDFPEQWAEIMNNLASAYTCRINGERAKNLEKSITYCKCSLEVRTRKRLPEQWARTCRNMANSYSVRILGERAENLELAILIYKDILDVNTKETFPIQWSEVQNNLANAYIIRLRGDRADNLEQAISAYQLALTVRTYETFPEQWAKTQHNLAVAYWKRSRGNKADNLERAISACRLALTVRTYETFPEQWARTNHNLAILYLQRIEGDRSENLEESIILYERALKVHTYESYPEQWAGSQNNLGTVYSERIRNDREQNLKYASTCYERALKVYTCSSFPNDCRNTSRFLGNLQAELQNWRPAITAYSQALNSAERLYATCLMLDGRIAELKETAALPRRAAYAYAKTDHLQTAVTTIERGRARGLTENLQRDRADLEQLKDRREDLYDRYRDITNQLRNLESLQRDRSLSDQRNELTPEAHRTTAQNLNQQLTETLEEIRKTPGYETFLQPTEFSDIQPHLPSDRPVIYLVTTPNGSLALIVTPDRIDPLWLDDFKEDQLDSQIQTWLTVYGEYKAADEEYKEAKKKYRAEQTESNRKALESAEKKLKVAKENWKAEIETVTGQLWESLMSPLINGLKDANHHRAILVLTGYLSFLPLHAAWTADATRPTSKRYAIDEIHFTYAPNAQSLLAARAIADRHSQLRSILAIEDPNLNIDYAAAPTATALRSFPANQHLLADAATVKAFKTALREGYDVVSLYCHGKAQLEDPLRSGLLLNDGTFVLADFFELNLADSNTGGIRLALLAACETGLPGIELTDEAIGLPVGLMQAGVAAVIAPLWIVDDEGTSLLMQKFFALWHDSPLEPDEALRQAQIWLRDSTNGEIEAEVDGYESFGDDDRDFAHPFFWSAFSYLGV